MQGMTKKTPGPDAPPDRSLPSLKMTALSYSWTTFTEAAREHGRVSRISRMEKRVIRNEQISAPSVKAERQNIEFNLPFLTCYIV